MRLLFAVQGEGRGHMTQAIALRELATQLGHEVVAVLVGGEPTRPLPSFFESAFDAPVRRISSPGFNFRGDRGVSGLATLGTWLRRSPEVPRSVAALDGAVRSAQPDLIVSFLEPLVGLYKRVRWSRVPVLAIGHHFLMLHPGFLRIRRFPLDRLGMMAYVRWVGHGATRMGLSFYPMPDLVGRRLYISPPLLRRRVRELVPDPAGRFLLVYLLKHGYRADVERWHRAHPEVDIHCFYDRPGAPEQEIAAAGLTFHRLHGELFLEKMAACRAVASTAGFESLAEAAFLGKPVLAIPVENHVEQFINACDAESAGLAIRGETFDLTRLMGASGGESQARFREWARQADNRVGRILEIAAGSAGAAGEGGRGTV